MRENLRELIKKYWIETVVICVLIFIVLLFSSQIKQFFGVRGNEIRIMPVAPVDRSKERDIITCLQNRIDPEIVNVCTNAFKGED